MTRGITTDILDGLSSSVAVKGPCAVKTTANVTLAGEQTIDGVTTSESRVLVGSQTDTTQNGIWVTSSGDWRRAADFSRNDDVVSGTFVAVTGGSTGSGLWMASFTGALAIDTTAITFTSLTALLGYASLVSPAFTGNPTAPTASPGDNDTSIATTGFVTAAVAVLSAAVSATIAALGAFADNVFFVTGSADATKKLRFEVDGITTATTRVATPPNADFTMAATNVELQTLAGGANVTVKDLGALSAAGSNTITPNPGNRPIQKITNDHAGSILPGSNEGQYSLEVINTTGAGALTTTGWTLKGDSFDTTVTSKFLCACFVTSDIKTMIITKVA